MEYNLFLENIKIFLTLYADTNQQEMHYAEVTSMVIKGLYPVNHIKLTFQKIHQPAMFNFKDYEL
jgi:hypothetical protein